MLTFILVIALFYVTRSILRSDDRVTVQADMTVLNPYNLCMASELKPYNVTGIDLLALLEAEYGTR